MPVTTSSQHPDLRSSYQISTALASRSDKSTAPITCSCIQYSWLPRFAHQCLISLELLGIISSTLSSFLIDHQSMAWPFSAQTLSTVQEGVDGFLEESIVRRELSDNYVFYVKNYDKFEAAADWAKTFLDIHRKDKREYLYSL